LHSCLQHRSCDAEEFLRSESKTGTSADRDSELLCGGNAFEMRRLLFRATYLFADKPDRNAKARHIGTARIFSQK
jgi:hypothetical protein